MDTEGMYLSKTVAVVIVVIITLVNSFNVNWAVRLQEALSLLQFLALAVVCIAGLVVPQVPSHARCSSSRTQEPMAQTPIEISSPLSAHTVSYEQTS